MKPTYEEVIERLRNVIIDCEETDLYPEDVAKAVLRALQDMMPDVNVMGETTKYYDANDALDKYNHFKTMGR